jgi:hypothetical protein
LTEANQEHSSFINTSESKMSKYPLMQNEINLSGMFQGIEVIKFAESQRALTWTEPVASDSDHPRQIYTMVQLQMDRRSKQYVKSSGSFLDLICDLGGLLCFIIALTTVFVRPVVKRILQSHLISKLYQVQKYTKDFSSLDGRYEASDLRKR